MPGKYSVTMYQMADGKTEKLSQPQQFDVVPLRKGHCQQRTIQRPLNFFAGWRIPLRK